MPNTFERLGDKQYRSSYMAICRSCKGSGISADCCKDVCPTCQGSGRVLIIKEIKVTVEPYNK